jgi:pescadillo protein
VVPLSRVSNRTIKERYPTFAEAMRDLDDALSMIFLFATLPQNRFLRDHVIERCARLSSEWMSYVIRSRCLRKVFCSIKGVYYQASVMGEIISWLVPYPYTPNVPENVDFKVMLTFLEFHMKHLEFVMFRLHGQLGLSYPPAVNQALARNGATILAYQFKEIGAAAPTAGAAASSLRNVDENDEYDDDDEDDEGQQQQKGEQGEVTNAEQARALEAEVNKIATQLKSAGVDTEAFGEVDDDEVAAQNEQLDKAGDEFRQLARLEGQADGVAELDPLPTLFRGLVFFLGRENLRDVLYVTLAACGATVGWEGPDSPFDASSPAITHVICDRPSVAEPRADVEYVQPQWAFDSVNFAFLLPVSEYAPGSSLPPHLSPFVNDEQEGYVPERKQQILRFIEQSKLGLAPPAITSAAADDEERELDEGELDHVDAEELFQEGLAAETGRGSGKSALKRAKERRRDREEAAAEEKEEEKTLQAGTLTRKKRRLYERIQYSKKKKATRADGLKEKAKAAKKNK